MILFNIDISHEYIYIFLSFFFSFYCTTSFYKAFCNILKGYYGENETLWTLFVKFEYLVKGDVMKRNEIKKIGFLVLMTWKSSFMNIEDL
jgi:hypothetical protein